MIFSFGIYDQNGQTKIRMLDKFYFITKFTGLQNQSYEVYTDLKYSHHVTATVFFEGKCTSLITIILAKSGLRAGS